MTMHNQSPAATETFSRLHLNENPLGASPNAMAAAELALRDINRYPDPAHTGLIRAIARRRAVDEARIAVGNGVDEVILMIALAFRAESRLVLLNSQTFQVYARSVRAVGLPSIEQPLRDYRIDVERVVASFAEGVRLAFVCNPHNPTAALLCEEEVHSLCAAAQRHDAVVVFDEAYAEYVPEQDFASAIPRAAAGRNVCVMRTFSKAYGLGGLRVGYLIGDPDVIARINKVQSAFPFHVNRIAQAAAEVALADEEFLERTRTSNRDARDLLCRGLDELGVEHLPSKTNFVLIRLPGLGSHVAETLRRADRTLVRDTADLGLVDYLRVSVGSADEVVSFLRKLEKVLHQQRDT
ncbi:pyridoxal phosphate-dependent aminotransferase [Actinophytocola sp.]|uniref:pyridoxal phosphate-dependent aminotransferase n=1 Tax=Actinophytocola sp. TaxID=1872138 RepID=UPI00389A6BD1